MGGAGSMSRHRLALLLLAVAVVVFAALVPAARREREAARQQYALAREERERLRVRLADLSRRNSEDARAPAADGAGAVRMLREAVLRATHELPVSSVEISVSGTTSGAIAARGRFAAVGGFTDVLRLARRIASSSSGLLLERVSFGEVREGVRLEAEAFILKEEP
jgi:hypothetical protein